MKFFFINRVLYAALLLFSVVVMFAWIMPHDVMDLADIEPLKIEIFKAPDFADAAQINQPSRNVFDPEGRIWQKPRSIASTNDTQGSTRTPVLGLLRLYGLEGVLTPQGFIPVGKSINGGKLVSVGLGQYIVEIEGQRTVFPVDESIEKRRKHFSSIGLPFLK